MKTKLKQIKQAIKNPPPERLARVEYQSHFLQMVGITFVCIMLFVKGYWYVIFALIFGLGVSYSQGITAYQKYWAIMEIVGKKDPKEFDTDISFTRRRSQIINFVFGSWTIWVVAILSVGFTMYILPVDIPRWILVISYILTIIALYIFLYYFVLYWFAYPFYKMIIRRQGK